MRVKENLIPELVEVIADHVPPAVLADVVAIQGVVNDFETLAKRVEMDDPGSHAKRVATTVVSAYQNLGRTETLVTALVRRDRSNALFTSRIAELVLRNLDDKPQAAGSPRAISNEEAALVKRAQMLRMPQLMDFMRQSEGRICVIATRGDSGEPTRLGTGFLVGPDLVITARHVLGAHIVDGKGNIKAPEYCCAYFDHTDGDPINDPADDYPRARRVAFHSTDWLRCCSDSLPQDGRIEQPTESEIGELKNHLDMVLIRLAEPIGNYSRRRTGGSRRGWIEPTPVEHFRPPEKDERIIIPQHPHGHPQQIDFGRFKLKDESETRIRYDTETEPGTSGAPCFNQNFKLVGMHNVFYQPPGVPDEDRLNQAVRFDHILLRLKDQVGASPTGSSRLWSVAESDRHPEVIVGRDAFQKWISEAATDNPSGLAQRVYVAEGLRRRCGKSFSIRILRAARRDQPERIVIMCGEHDRVPRSPLDFIRVIADQLRLPPEVLAKVPPRPSRDLPENSGDGDKSIPWLSRDIPQWFEQTLREHRVRKIDLRQEAAETVRLYRQKGLLLNKDDEAIALRTSPVLEERTLWQRVWIVLDDLTEASLSDEVKELLAGLTCARMTEASIPEELRRLRWIFLGRRPEFLERPTVETLDQMEVSPESIAVCIRAFAETFNENPPAELIDRCAAIVNFVVGSNRYKADYDNPDTRLVTLQGVIGELDQVLATVRQSL